MPDYKSMEEAANAQMKMRSGVKMSPYKAYGKMKNAPKMMGEPSILKMCGSKRHGGKKK